MKKLLVTLAAVTMASTLAVAQQKAPAEAKTFAKKVAAANTFEIQSSQLAKDRTQSGELRSFAQQMIADHTKAGEEFKSAVQAADVSPPPREQPDARQKATLSKLRNAQGSAFDKAYVAAQLKAHEQAVSLFRAYAKNGHTAQLKDFATKTLPTLEHHLEMIQAISKKGGVASRS
jgi:putative membrane protein